MKFLILGGNGYLGSKVTVELLKTGHEIFCTTRENSDLLRLKGYESQMTFIPVGADKIEHVLKTGGFDWILNMACNYGKGTVLYYSVIESNIVFPLAILDLAVKYGVKNFMTIGTGLPDRLNMYSFSKSIFSDFGKFYVEKQGINFVNMKLEMFYGADEPKDRFIPDCIMKMLQNKDVDLTPGRQKRDIIAVQDVIGAILCVIDSGIEGFQEIYVGTGEAPTIYELLTYIKRKTRSKSNLNFGVIPERIGEPDCIADITKLAELGYTCRYSWKQGIENMIGEVMENENLN